MLDNLINMPCAGAPVKPTAWRPCAAAAEESMHNELRTHQVAAAAAVPTLAGTQLPVRPS